MPAFVGSPLPITYFINCGWPVPPDTSPLMYAIPCFWSITNGHGPVVANENAGSIMPSRNSYILAPHCTRILGDGTWVVVLLIRALMST